MTFQSIAKKYRTALRNETGLNFTNAQLRLMAEAGFLEQIAKLEAEELCPAKRHATSSETIGSTKDGTVPRRTSGKSPIITNENGLSFIEALGSVR